MKKPILIIFVVESEKRNHTVCLKIIPADFQ